MPKTLNVSEFRKQALDLLDHLPPEGVLIAKRGKPVAHLVPVRGTIADLIGSMRGKLHIRGDVFSTGIRWEAEDDLPRHAHCALYSDRGFEAAGKSAGGARAGRYLCHRSLEITKLFQRGRIDVSLEDPVLARTLSRMTIWPVDRDVCLQLNGLDFQSDPADEVIAATSLAHQVPLLTRDRQIRTSRKVPLA